MRTVPYPADISGRLTRRYADQRRLTFRFRTSRTRCTDLSLFFISSDVVALRASSLSINTVQCSLQICSMCMSCDASLVCYSRAIDGLFYGQVYCTTSCRCIGTCYAESISSHEIESIWITLLQSHQLVCIINAVDTEHEMAERSPDTQPDMP